MKNFVNNFISFVCGFNLIMWATKGKMTKIKRNLSLKKQKFLIVSKLTGL